MRRKTQTFMCGLVALALALGLAGAPATAQELLDATSWRARPAAVARSVLQAERLPRDVNRWRSVDVRRDTLDLARTPGAQADITLFDDTSLRLVIDAVTERTADDASFTGRVAGAPRSMVNIVQKGDVVLMDIWTPDMGTYQVRYAGDGLHVVREIDPTVKGRCGLDAAHVAQDSAERLAEPSQEPAAAPTAAGGPEALGVTTAIDLVIAYTPAAATEQGGSAAIEALAQLLVDGSNTIYSGSSSTAELNLLGTAMVNYTETPGEDMGVLRNKLRDPMDLVMDEVHAWRDQLGADLVALLISDQVDESGLYGIAFIAPFDDPSKGFSVTKANAAGAPNWSFTHEVGHNNGARHDHNDLVTNGPPYPQFPPPDGLPDESPSPDDHASYSWGHYWSYDETCDTEIAHTLMARLGNPGDRYAILSNPALGESVDSGFLCLGSTFIPYGVAEGQPNEADNARTHSERRPIMAAWVGNPTETYVDFSCPAPSTQWWYCSLFGSINVLEAGGTIRLAPGSSSETGVINQPLTLTTAGGGPATIGQ